MNEFRFFLTFIERYFHRILYVSNQFIFGIPLRNYRSVTLAHVSFSRESTVNIVFRYNECD